MPKRAQTVNVNLRLPAGLHKRLVKVAADASPPNSLNSEILARLFDSFDRHTEAEVQELKAKVKEAEAYAMTRMEELDQFVETRLNDVEQRADELVKKIESSLVKTRELQRRAERKLK